VLWGQCGEEALHRGSAMATVRLPGLLALAYLQVVAVIAHGWRLWPQAAARAWFGVQPCQALLPKPVDPLVDLRTAHAHHRGNRGDRQPVRQE
jgi:hypothetical protein